MEPSQHLLQKIVCTCPSENALLGGRFIKDLVELITFSMVKLVDDSKSKIELTIIVYDLLDRCIVFDLQLVPVKLLTFLDFFLEDRSDAHSHLNGLSLISTVLHFVVRNTPALLYSNN